MGVRGGAVLERTRVVGIALLGVVAGVAALLAAARPVGPGEAAVVVTGGDREVVQGGWTVELPGREIERYRLREPIAGESLLLTGDGVPVRVAWSATRILDPGRLGGPNPGPPGWDLSLPRLLVASAVVRLGGRLKFEEVYGPGRPELTRCILDEIVDTLGTTPATVEGLRLAAVVPLGEAAERLPMRPPRLFIVALDDLDRRTVERLAADGRLPTVQRLTAAGSTLFFENPEPDEPGRFWQKLLTGGLAAGDWIERRARRGWLTGLVHAPVPTGGGYAESLAADGTSTPYLAALMEVYAGPVYDPPDPRLLAGEAGLEEAVRGAVEGSRAAGALLESGAAAVLWGSDLFGRFYDALWPLVQRYRSVGYGERFRTETHLGEADLVRAAETGALAERLLVALDRFLGDLLARHPDLTVVLVSSGGYGPRPGISEKPWGPTGEAWMLLAGPHVRPLGEREGTVEGAASVLGELILVERLSEEGGIGEREILEPWYRSRLTLTCPPPEAVDSRGAENYTQRARLTGAETDDD
jgi:hypothetical protein